MTQQHPLLQVLCEEIAKLDPAYKKSEKIVPLFKSPPPAHLGGGTVAQDAAEHVEWSAEAEARVRSALKVLSADCPYDQWLSLGMALHSLDWDCGLQIWDDWSRTASNRYQEGVCEAKWATFHPGETKIGTLFFKAREQGWEERAFVARYNVEHPAPAPEPGTIPVLPTRITWPVLTGGKNPRAQTNSPANVEAAVRALGIECRYDMFHEKIILHGHHLRFHNDNADHVLLMLSRRIYQNWGCEFTDKAIREGVWQVALEHQFHPIRDYLATLTWDGIERLDNCFATYLGSPADDYHRGVARLLFTAAVKRVMEPGCKLDSIFVFEGEEGLGKSEFLTIMAGEDNHSDQSIFNKDDRVQQENMLGVWIYECAELTGIKRTEVEHVTSFISRRFDRCRPAYGRHRVDRARQGVICATSNDSDYLTKTTGNRRFLPILVEKEVDLELVRADRDQLWAEAIHHAAKVKRLELPRALWGVAKKLQEDRRTEDPWEVILANARGTICTTPDGMGQEERIFTRTLFERDLALRGQADVNVTRRLARVMRALGWEKPPEDCILRIGAELGRGYRRKVPDPVQGG